MATDDLNLDAATRSRLSESLVSVVASTKKRLNESNHPWSVAQLRLELSEPKASAFNSCRMRGSVSK